jgi:mitochondrial fission protein ELM1
MNSDRDNPMLTTAGRAAHIASWEERERAKARIRIQFADQAISAHVWQCCINCEHWDRKDNRGCEKFQAMPPPHVIVRGCDDHAFDIPF